MEHPERPHSLQERREQIAESKSPKQRPNTGLWAGFSDGSSSDRLTEEQENEIAENIYDWWVSGKAYKQWYNEKFNQTSLDFKE